MIMGRYSIKASEYSSHSTILKLLGDGHGQSLLDVGAADGSMGLSFRNLGWDVTGIEPDYAEYRRASELGLKIHHMTLDSAIVELTERYDAIVLGDVLEHVNDPWSQLSDLASLLCHADTKVIISIPNIAHIVPRLKLLFGRFEYEDRGILDRTHLRFFTRQTALDLFRGSGLICTQLHATPTPLELVYPPLLDSKIGRHILTVNARASKAFPRLIGYQFIAVCQPALA